MIRLYLSNMINDQKSEGEWKIHLTMTINFMSCKDSEKTRNMGIKSHNAEIMMDNETEEYIKELFKCLLQNYQKYLEESMKGSEFVFDSADLLYYHLQKISLKRGGSHVDSPKWLKKSNNKSKK